MPIQIGIAGGDRPDGTDAWEFCSLIGQWDWREWEWNEEAARVHGISQEDLEDAQPVWKVDILAAATLLKQGVGQRMFNIAVGWNVGSFDRQFITRWFPNMNRILSYRVVDLNTLCFALAGGEEAEFERIKKRAKKYAAERLGGEGWHDALFDAKAALFAFEALKMMMRGLDPVADS